MHRRYAILDDNQQTLEMKLDALRECLPGLIGSRACAAAVIGSVAAGCARDESDLDLLVVLRDGEPRRTDYAWWDDTVTPHLQRERRFPVQPVLIARASVGTDEPHLRTALETAVVLWDPERLLHDQSEARA